MSSSPISRSQASLSPSNASPSHSMSKSYQDPSLETLVSHLLASKRSLSSISTAWRANEIVTSARAKLEESVRLNARTEFLRSGIIAQVKLLKRVRGGVEGVYREGTRDFKAVIKTLDAANARLETTMDILRSTMVEAAFRPKDEEPRSLLDFVDEQGVETMRDALKESIREAKEAQTDFDTSILSFDNDIRALKAALRSSPSSSRHDSHNELSSPIPEHLHTLETNAQEMAHLLESLVAHFDLCVNAIRHTEGGYAAVRKAANSQPPDTEHVSVSGVMATENDSTIGEPVSEEERAEMLKVLEADAAQVEDVVMELREFLNEMEVRHEAILEHVASLNTTHEEITNAYQILVGVSARLPGYIVASQEFRARWEDTKLNIQEELNELESMRMFYENYQSSYDGLILEVHRRKGCEEKVKGILKRAMEQVEKVIEQDGREREGFRLDVGEYLPVDLWPGVNAKPARWEWGIVGGGGGVGGGGERQDGSGEGVDRCVLVPELGKSVVEAAARRDRERQRHDR